MIKLLLLGILCVVATTAMSHAGTVAWTGRAELLSLATFHVTNGVSVQLPKVRLADGTVCQSYVASAARHDLDAGGSSVAVTMGQICGEARIIKTAFGGQREEIVPANLKAMRTVNTDGLAVQLPQLID